MKLANSMFLSTSTPGTPRRLPNHWDYLILARYRQTYIEKEPHETPNDRNDRGASGQRFYLNTEVMELTLSMQRSEWPLNGIKAT